MVRDLPHRRWGSTAEGREGVAGPAGDGFSRRYPAPAARDPSPAVPAVPSPSATGRISRNMPQLFSRHPVLKIHQITARQASMKAKVMARLTPTPTSEWP